MRPFLWDEGSWTPLQPLDGYEGACPGEDLGDGGQVVGRCRSVDNPNIWRAVLWTNGQAIDLTEQLRTRRGIVVERAWACGRRGAIVADGTDEQFDVVTVVLHPTFSGPDLDGDCVVGVKDLSSVLDHWGVVGSAADLDGSGVVGFGDLLQVLAGWG